jgi:hypothetical protein
MVAFSTYFVFESNSAPDLVIQLGFNDQNIIVLRCGVIFTVGFGDRKINALFLYRLIGKAQGPEHLVAPDLKPPEIVSIIGLTHIIRVAVNYAGGCLVI